jgi:hypothetical protein
MISKFQGNINWLSINQSIYDNFDKIVDLFGLELEPDGDEWVGPCVVHPGSDNSSAFRVFDTASWWCFTRGCADGQASMVYLLKRILETRHNIECNLPYCCEWYIENILEGKNILNIPQEYRERTTYEHVPKIFFESRQEWRLFAGTTSPSYIGKGFTRGVVNQYNIGECHDRSNRFYNRIVVPQLDRRGRVVGYTGRSLFPQCGRCELYHSVKAPCPTEFKSSFRKWIHAKGFRTAYHLYNDWNPSDSSEVYLVESVGNTLRMVESGYNNTYGMFGSVLSGGQAQILEGMGVKRINWIVDNDYETHAGLEGARRSKEKYSQFNIRIIRPPAPDIAELKPKEVKQFLELKGIA